MTLRTFLDIAWGTSHVPPWSLSSLLLLLGYIILLFAANQPHLDEMSGLDKCMIKHRMETGDGTRSPQWGLQDGKELQKKALAVFFLVDTPKHLFGDAIKLSSRLYLRRDSPEAFFSID